MTNIWLFPTLGIYLSTLFGFYAAGFGCATVLFVGDTAALEKSGFEKFIAGLAIRRYFQKHHEAKQEQQEQDNERAEQISARKVKPWL